MTVGAMLSAGLPIEHLREELSKIHLHGYRVSSRLIERSMISAVKFDVETHDHEHTHQDHHKHTHQDHHKHSHQDHHEHQHALQHAHSHHHDHHGHSHGHSHSVTETHVHTHGLSHAQIVELFNQSHLSGRVKQTAIQIFHEIAIAEARIHNVSLDHVHFHEVGALDSILDIASVAIGLEFFDIDACYSRAVPLGAGGTINTAHGIMPIPTPATLDILKDHATELGPVYSEMTTPTGAGIIKALSKGVLPQTLSIKPLATGYGAGQKEFREIPNLLRIIIAETSETSRTVFTDSDIIIQLTTTIDDMTPQALAFVEERLLGVSLDVYSRSVSMKKNRAGHELIVLCEPGEEEKALEILARETTTIGVRVETIARRLHPREAKVIEHPEFGPVLMKQIQAGGTRPRLAPEFEDAKRIARERGLPLQEVLARLNALGFDPTD